MHGCVDKNGLLVYSLCTNWCYSISQRFQTPQNTKPAGRAWLPLRRLAGASSNSGYLNTLLATYKTKKATQNLTSGKLKDIAERIRFSACSSSRVQVHLHTVRTWTGTPKNSVSVKVNLILILSLNLPSAGKAAGGTTEQHDHVREVWPCLINTHLPCRPATLQTHAHFRTKICLQVLIGALLIKTES